MKHFTLLFCVFTLLLTSCSSVEKEDLQNLNGFWEIHKVIQPEGEEVDFSINTIYDYYEIDATNKGIYRKASPQLDGTFLVDNFQEEIEIIERDGKFFIKFNSEFNEREVIIVELTNKKLILRNPDLKTYYYKRAEPIDITKDEE